MHAKCATFNLDNQFLKEPAAFAFCNSLICYNVASPHIVDAHTQAALLNVSCSHYLCK